MQYHSFGKKSRDERLGVFGFSFDFVKSRFQFFTWVAIAIFWLGDFGNSAFAIQGADSRTNTSSKPSKERQKDKSKKPRSSIQINRDISAFLRNEALAKTEFERAAAIRDLCRIAIEVRFDPRFGKHLHMNPLMRRIRNRLTKILKKNDLGERSTDGLGQLAEFDSENSRTDDSLSDHLELAGFSSGGPLSFFASTHGANGGGIIRQNADDLINLIQTTIAPSFWDVNGGPGSIVFFPQFNALVVRATEEIHYKIGGAVEQLEFHNR